MTLAGTLAVLVFQFDQLLPRGTRVDVFTQIYWVFLGLGTLVGVVVIGYMLYNAWQYRDDGTPTDSEVDRPELGELPEGGGKGRKLFVSFALSAIIVITLILWTYAMLLYVEGGVFAQDRATVDDAAAENRAAGPLVVEVTGIQFSWQYTYPNGHTTSTLVVPEDRRVRLKVTSDDVFHTYGIPAFRVKTDAIPGQTTRTWFEAERTGTFQAQCYELCGSGHSYMTSDVRVVSQDEFQSWYARQSAGENATDTPATTSNETTQAPTANATGTPATPEVTS
jgi:cytochrome c oxidase subunit 2